MDSKRKALVDIGRHLGSFVASKEIAAPGKFDSTSTDELRAAVLERAEVVLRDEALTRASWLERVDAAS